MKKLLITYASYGSGHKAVGMYIKDYFEARGYEVMTIDLLNYAIPVIGSFTKVANEFLMTKIPSMWSLLYFAFDNRLTCPIYQKTSLKMFDNKKLRKEIVDFNPDLVIATHFYGSSLIAKYKKNNIINPKLITVVTDYKAHEIWLKEVKNTDAIIVSGVDEKRKLMKYGYTFKQIYTSGIPIMPVYDLNISREKLIKKFKINKNYPTVLFFCGGGNGALNNLKYLKAILKSENKFNLLVIAGKNKKAKEKSLDYVKKYNKKNAKVFGFVTNIAEFYMVSDLVITKPGGAQVTECLYFKKPMMLIKSNGGQEIENRLFLIKKGYAVASWSIYGFLKKFDRMISDNRILSKMSLKISKINQEKSMDKLFNTSEKLLK